MIYVLFPKKITFVGMQKSIFNKIAKRALIISGLVVITSFTVIKYAFNKNDVIIELLLGNLDQFHYAPQKRDDAFSEKVFNLYLRNLDFNKKFFLQSDIDNLSKYKTQIDDQLQAHSYEFYDLANSIIKKSITQKQEWCREILSKPMDYSVSEEYETDWKKTTYSKTEAELKHEWEKMLKYQVLARIDDELNKQEKAQEKKDTSVIIKPFDSLEVDARRKTLKANEDWFKRLNKKTDRDRFADFANAITGVYDPHTEYYAPREKKKFDQSMSGQFEGIGARLQSKDGILKVSEIIVGSPSYKQGELKAGDEIHKVAQGDGEPVDITDMDMEDAIELIKGKKGTEVRLTVKKSDNSFKVIPIIRDVILIEETYAKSALLENNKNKIGYIYLPAFYTDFTRTGAHHCAQDVRAEIEKLKKQKVKGIILDLRNNGGGSLQEVIEMAGLFFPKGPVVQVKGKNNLPPNIMEDKNPDVVWDGNLAVMINRSSASASEIMAAAMQDYKRAIIIGTPSFGKGTVQSFINLDAQLLRQFDTIKPIGEVKITQQKFYRINGGATQLRGVTPEILLPDPYDYIDVGEKELDNPMVWDEINKANYTEFNKINYSTLIKNSEKRVKQNAQFALVEQEAKEIKAKKDDTKYALKFEDFRAEQKQLRDQNKKYEELRKSIKNFSATMLDEDKARYTAINDTSRLGQLNRWVENVAKDIYIHEAGNVINDMK